MSVSAAPRLAPRQDRGGAECLTSLALQHWYAALLRQAAGRWGGHQRRNLR